MRSLFFIPAMLAFTLLLSYSCNRGRTAGEVEAWEDKEEFAEAKRYQDKITASVTAYSETKPIPRKSGDDAADDPAIWVHPSDPTLSLVFGTDKKGGLGAYDLQGNEKAYYNAGKLNNVDIRYGFDLNGRTVDLLAASNRSINGISLFVIDTTNGALEEVNGGSLSIDSTVIDDAYGFCFYRQLSSDRYFAIVNGKNGHVMQYQVVASEENNGIEFILAREFDIPSQPEGMVADDELNVLYVGEEGKGIWRFPAAPEDPANGSVIPLSGEDNPDIRFDMEGIALYIGSMGKGYLVASSQGSFSYAIFSREGPNKYYGSFKILDGMIDGVEETDGLDVINIPLGEDFPAGMLVVQDGFNYEGDSVVAQNFKMVRWEKVDSALDLSLGMDTTYRKWMGR